MRRSLIPALPLAIVLALGVAPAAHAIPSESDFTDAEVAESIRALDTHTRIAELEHRVTPLETVRKQGADTQMLLQSDLLFDFAKWDLTPAAVAKIGELVEKIPQGVAVEVAGHTDSKGDTASNQQLSERRAQSVADAIRSARPDLKLKVTGHGESKPIAENTSGGKDNPEGRAQNRRVEVRYTG